MKRNITLILILVLLTKLALSMYGLTWGAPDRWNQDERINASLKIVTEKTFYYSNIETAHPIVYYYFLFMWLVPYLLALKLTGFNFEAAGAAASTSWLAMTKAAPDFANGLLIAGRSSSVVLGLLTVFLVYLIAKKIFDDKTAILSAIVATLNLGLLGTNHFARSENLSLFLIFLSLYIWAVILKEDSVSLTGSTPKLYLSFFLSGLAMGTKIDSAILLVGVVFMLYWTMKKAGSLFDRLKILFFTAALVFSGLILGFLRLIIPVKESLGLKENGLQRFSCLFAAPTLEHAKLVFLKIISMYNCVIAIFLFAGLALCLIRLKRMHKFMHLLLFMLSAYYLVIFFFYSFVSTNLLVISLPAMSIFAGYGLKIFWDKMARMRASRAILLASILIYSLVYAVKADLVFAKNDTRYMSTRWMEQNIPAGATIGIIQEPELLFSSRLVGKYGVYYNGERVGYENNPYIKQKTEGPPNEAEQIKKLSSFDYAVVSSWDYMVFEVRQKDMLNEKLSDIKDMELVKSFRCKEDIFLNPRPTYTSPAIFIFKVKRK